MNRVPGAGLIAWPDDQQTDPSSIYCNIQTNNTSSSTLSIFRTGTLWTDIFWETWLQYNITHTSTVIQTTLNITIFMGESQVPWHPHYWYNLIISLETQGFTCICKWQVVKPFCLSTCTILQSQWMPLDTSKFAKKREREREIERGIERKRERDYCIVRKQNWLRLSWSFSMFSVILACLTNHNTTCSYAMINCTAVSCR